MKEQTEVVGWRAVGMKGTLLFVACLLVASTIGAVSWTRFVTMIAPHLSRTDTAIAVVSSVLGIICLSVLGALLVWVMIQFHAGRLAISSDKQGEAIKHNNIKQSRYFSQD